MFFHLLLFALLKFLLFKLLELVLFLFFVLFALLLLFFELCDLQFQSKQFSGESVCHSRKRTTN